MPAKSVPITYGMDIRDMDGLRQLIEKEFPFSRENISGGCIAINDPKWPTTGKCYVCPECVTAWKRWIEAALKKAAEKNKPK